MAQYHFDMLKKLTENIKTFIPWTWYGLGIVLTLSEGKNKSCFGEINSFGGLCFLVRYLAALRFGASRIKTGKREMTTLSIKIAKCQYRKIGVKLQKSGMTLTQSLAILSAEFVVDSPITFIPAAFPD